MLDPLSTLVRRRWRTLLNMFWFIPGLISFIGPLLAIIFLIIDHNFKITDETFVFSAGSTEASTMLATIAGSLITVAGLAFSITIVVLQLVSSQYTPRALRGFLQDRTTQVVAGSFFAIFAYALIVLTQVHDPSPPADAGFIPVLSVTIALLLSFIGLVLLLVFIHHTGSIIQVSHIVARTATQTVQAITTDTIDRASEEEVSRLIHSWYPGEKSTPVYAPRFGYIQRIALPQLAQSITHPQMHIHLLVSPGDFVTEETVIARIWTVDGVDEGLGKTLQHNVHIDKERDIAEDARFGVRQLADIALRALSPAINDPTTGVLCIKHLQVVFEQLVRQRPVSSIIPLLGGTSTLVVLQTEFKEYLEVFLEIGFYAGGSTRVISAMLVVLAKLAKIAITLDRQEQQEVIASVAAMLVANALPQVPAEQDRVRLQELLKQVERVLKQEELEEHVLYHDRL